jgi:hypothetical protein
MSDVFESIKSDKPSVDKEHRAIEHVRAFMKSSQDYRKPHLEWARISRDLYECWQSDGKSLIQRANIKLPYGYTVIETQLPQVVEGILRERPFIEFEGLTPQDMQWENELTDFYDSQVEAMKFPLKLLSYVKSMKLDGTAFAKVPYKYVEQEVMQRQILQDPLTGQPYMAKIPQMKVAFDGPDFENIPMVDFFPDWGVKLGGDIQSMRGVCHRTWRTLSELKKNKKKKQPDGTTTGIYSNLDDLELSVNRKGCGDGVAWKSPYYSAEYSNSFDRHNDNKLGIKDKDKIEVWEFWGLFDKNDDGDFQEYIITIANGDCELRCDENFYDSKVKPFVASPNVPRDGEFYGIPELLAVKGLIKESNSMRNAVLDQVNISINQMFVVDRNAGIKAKSLYSRPSGIIWANDINGLREVKSPEINASVYRSFQDIQTDIQNAVGQGTSPGTPSTFNNSLARSATGAQYLQSFSASRAGLALRILGETLLKPMYFIMGQENKQFVTDDKFVRISDPNKTHPGNPFTILPSEAFNLNYHFSLKDKIETGGDQNEMQKLQAFMQLAQTMEATQPGVIIWENLEDDVGRKLLGKHVRKFTRTAQERLALQQQQVFQEQAAQAQAGAQAPQPNQVGSGGSGGY